MMQRVQPRGLRTGGNKKGPVIKPVQMYRLIRRALHLRADRFVGFVCALEALSFRLCQQVMRCSAAYHPAAIRLDDQFIAAPRHGRSRA